MNCTTKPRRIQGHAIIRAGINYLVDPNSGLKQVMTEFLNAVMLFEAYLQSGALPYERTHQRKAHRNGMRPRTLKTRIGEITLDKPQC